MWIDAQMATTGVVAAAFLVLAAGAWTNAGERPGVRLAATSALLLAAATLQTVVDVGGWATQLILLAVAAALMCWAAQKMLTATRDWRMRRDEPAFEHDTHALALRAAELARQVAEPSWRRVLWETPGMLLVNVGRDGRVRRVDGGCAKAVVGKPSDVVGRDLSVLGEHGESIRGYLDTAFRGQTFSWLARSYTYRIAPVYDAAGEVDGAVIVAVEG